MSLRNTPHTYGSLARALHWLIALLILGLLSIGFIMVEMGFSPLKLEIYALHKSFGLSVLILSALRLIWKAASTQPAHLPTHNKAERRAAKTAHILLYAAIFIMPLSGWVMSSAGDFPINFFGLYELPALVPKDETLYRISKEVHEISAYTLIAVIGLHFAGALKHHLIDADETLRRMGGNLFIAAVFAVLLAAPAYLAASHLLSENEKTEEIEAPVTLEETPEETPEQPQTASANGWEILHENSALGFTFSQYGAPTKGAFTRWDAEIVFDPENVENAHVAITIDITSIDTGSAERDTQARSTEWFDAQKFPQARFTSGNIEKRGRGRYHVHGTLDLGGVTQPVDFPFTLEISEENGIKTAHMLTALTLNRLDFAIGKGQWENEDTIAAEVKITVDLTAQIPAQ